MSVENLEKTYRRYRSYKARINSLHTEAAQAGDWSLERLAYRAIRGFNRNWPTRNDEIAIIKCIAIIERRKVGI